MTRRHAEINNSHSKYIFCGIIPRCNFQYRNRVRFITLIPFEIISRNLVQYKAWPAFLQRLKLVTPLTLFAELFPFLISDIDIVSALKNLILFEIISRNLVQIKVWPDFDCELLLLLHFFRFYAIILYMVSMEIVSFCRIIPLCNFQYRNHVHSITLISFQIISQNLVQI